MANVLFFGFSTIWGVCSSLKGKSHRSKGSCFDTVLIRSKASVLATFPVPKEEAKGLVRRKLARMSQRGSKRPKENTLATHRSTNGSFPENFGC
jgi:hypothetical protein